ncbi:159_t:CDS:2 [Acaulospora morrowiae]|uniref:159_t:CDS:1 n=1 Tax=Acaulospora morrowiae TaxID=94023 RepID=A0A9N8VA22_9GLOM|nr:159_t:CDS:2 [Acaulospora morrowiae]
MDGMVLMGLGSSPFNGSSFLLPPSEVNMDSVPSYYSNDNIPMSDKEPPQLLSSNFVQPEMPSESQGYAPMSDNGYPQDQFGMHSHSSLGPGFPIPEPPPYEHFKEYTWGVPKEFATILPQEDFNPSSILDSADEQFIFDNFLYNLQANPDYIFNPSLPTNMPAFPPPPDNSVNGLFKSMCVSHCPPGTILTSSPNQNHRELASSSQLPSQSSDEKSGSSTSQSVPAKRKQEGNDERSIRSPRPISPSMQLSNLSINSSGTSNNYLDNDNDESPGNTPSSSVNGSPSPRTPNRELAKNEEESGSASNLAETSSNENDNTTDDFAEIKSESKPTPQKSSRKPYKELLTEEEKRANHIASEQKRRNTIRAGFKELTDIIPTLKNVNNSKSTILFKAVDYIKYLERRNKNLKERAGLLEMRVEMEMRQGKRFHHNGFGPTMGFGHQRVGPMPISAGYGMMHNPMNGMNGMNSINGMGIPIGPGHPPPQTHVIPSSQMYFVSTGTESQQPMATHQQMIPSGSAVSSVNQTNNVFRNGMQIPQQPPHPTNNETNNNNGLVPGMKIPSDDDQEMMNHHHNGVDPGMVGAEHDGDTSMMVLNGNAPRVGVKCL